MPTKKRPKHTRRLLKRGKKATPRKTHPKKNFTKRWVAGLAHPPKGQRDFYLDTGTPRLCLRVTPTAKTFYWEKTVEGSTKRITIGRFPEINVEQAREIANDIAADYAKGVDVQESRKSAREEMTLGELWLDYRENRPRKIEGEYSPTLERVWKSFYKKWENKKLSEITFDKGRGMILQIRKRAPIRANRIQRHGHAMFNYARRELRWKGDNPFDFALVSEKGRARKARLKPHEMPQFMKGLEECSADMRVLFLCLLWTGRRVGEVRAMRWVDLDLDNGIWVLPKTKSGESQEAVLPVAVIDMLVERQRKIKSPWVFPSPSKSGHIWEIKKAWEQVREESGLHNLQARDLRRTMASWAQDVNVPIAVMQAQLGHASYVTTSKHYTKILEDVQRAALDTTVASMIAAAK